jgi:2-phospho-L-lactate guanylyltransferase
MAMDTVAAAASCGAVVVVVEDEADGAALASAGAVFVHHTRAVGLNESIRDGLTHGLAAAAPVHAGRVPDGGVAVLPGDLPGLRSAELADVLGRCAQHRFTVVADHQGTGTTLLTAATPHDLRPAYGPDSFRRHQALGAVPIELPSGASLRWDVDVVDDLDATVGPNTAQVLSGITTKRR